MRKIEVKGTIVGNADKWIYEWFGMDATCPKDVNAAISEANGEPLLVEINSGGGDVFAGSEIYTALKAYAGTVEINIVGLAASAASVIAQAGHSRISPTALFMVHNVSGSAAGDFHDMQQEAEIALIGEPVTMGSLAAGIEKQYGRAVRILCPLKECDTLLGQKDAVVLGEEAMEEALKSARIIVADPLYRPICPKDSTFYELPHVAFSGRIYFHNLS